MPWMGNCILWISNHIFVLIMQFHMFFCWPTQAKLLSISLYIDVLSALANSSQLRTKQQHYHNLFMYIYIHVWCVFIRRWFHFVVGLKSNLCKNNVTQIRFSLSSVTIIHNIWRYTEAVNNIKKKINKQEMGTCSYITEHKLLPFLFTPAYTESTYNFIENTTIASKLKNKRP